MQEEWISKVVVSQHRVHSNISHKHEGKTVYFIRHGESEANICTNATAKESDPKFLDSKLTPKGIDQARSLQDIVHNWDIELFIVSPLRRTMQTFCNAFETYPNIDQIPITIAPVVTEFYSHFMECKGRNKEELLKDENLTSLPLYHRLIPSLQQLKEDWWEIGNNEERLSHFSHLLHHTRANNICVVSHWGFIHRIFSSNPGYAENYSPENCDWIYSIWDRIGDSYKHLKISNETDCFNHLLYLNPNFDEYPQQISKIITKNLLLHQEKLKFHSNRKYSICLLPGGNRKKNGLLNEIISLQKSLKENSNSSLSPVNFSFFIPLTRFLDVQSQDHLFDLNACLFSIRNLVVQQKQTWRVSTPKISLLAKRSKISGKLNFISLAFDSFTIRDIIYKTLTSELSWIYPDHCCDILKATVCDIIDFPYFEDFLVSTIQHSPCLHGALISNVDYGWDYLFKRITWRLAMCSVDETGNDFHWEPVSFPLW